MNDKKVITWKDADQNLCTVAAYILSQAMKELRHTRQDNTWYPAQDGDRAEPGMGEDSGDRTWKSDNGKTDLYTDFNLPRQCWWSFQNIIRQELKEARKELEKNLYGQNRKQSTQKNRSRNETGRLRKSKYGRTKERE